MKLAMITLLFAQIVGAQTVRQEMAAANAALTAGEYATYLSHVERALELGPDRVTRPFIQYHVARAHALNGDPNRAFQVLELAWSEQIEGPMVAFAAIDPAFAALRDHERYRRLMNAVANVEIRIAPVAGSVFQIEGAGCNLAASIGSDGILLVDSGYPITAPAVRKALDARSSAAVKFIINTHEHYDHLGGNAVLGKEATLIAHPQARTKAAESDEIIQGVVIPPLPAASWPELTTESDATVHFNGEIVRAIALPAHSGSDLIVWFEGSKVLHLGDNYFPDTDQIYPGRTPRPFFEKLGPFLRSLPHDTKVMSGHAPVVALATFQAAYDATEKLFKQVDSMIAAGKSDQEILEASAAEKLPERWTRFYIQALRPQDPQ